MSITTSSRPYLGDTGQDIAARLPGAWTATVETYPRRHWQEDIVGSLWDSGDLFQAMVHDHVRCAIVLENPAGTALLLIERPGHASGYLLGAFATEEYDDNWDDPHAPRSIVLPAEAELAAQAVAHTFLPDYRSALHHRRLDTVMAALNRIRPDHETLQAIAESGRYSDGMPFDNPRLLKEMERSYADRGWRSFQDVLQHAPLLLSRCRPSASAWPQDAAALARLRDALASSQDAWAEFQDLRAELYSIPATLSAPEWSQVRSQLGATVLPQIATWLADGEAFERQARAAVPGGQVALSAPTPRLLTTRPPQPATPRPANAHR
ncbi:hypothetical protein [Streptomyces sp. H39-C1]|uniref:hypothetical protein n=1 Tax=Streptomyces sp. H39-C1 TaxID=3004355 RepID=UPI0022AE9354|nr:hypothetical protein [Streptomyces sp. H39-C1]MCZ4103631.1 hypothetical protein [Streptomyces sp. H39-C1]